MNTFKHLVSNKGSLKFCLAGAGRFTMTATLAALLVACGGGGGGSSSSPDSSATQTPGSSDQVQGGANAGVVPGGGASSNDDGANLGGGLPPAQEALKPVAGQIVGYISYDMVPVTADKGLNYAATQSMPARGVAVDAIDATGVVASAVTDAKGLYALAVPTGRQVQLRVQARIKSSDGRWDVAVRDNTSSGYPTAAPVYAMTSSAQTMPAAGMVLDLNAASGWTGSSYGEVRAAAPFAVLDQAYSSMRYVDDALAAAGQVLSTFPTLNIYWSSNNRSAVGSYAQGDIGTSSWTKAQSGVAEGLYILGKESLDSDEYDTSILIHEWMHYFENKLSRSDSPGGNHALGDKLDMRVAWSEGLASAMSSAMRGNASFIDTLGARQGQSSTFSVDTQPVVSDRGFFSERSVQYAVYQLSRLQGGAAAVLQTLLAEQKNTPAATSIFSFAAGLAPRMAAGATDTVFSDIGLPSASTLDAWGGSVSYVTSFASGIPVVDQLLSGIATAPVCVSNQYGSYNKLDRNRPIRLEVPAAGKWRLVATGTAALARVDLYRTGVWQPPVSEVALAPVLENTYQLQAGTYVAMLTDASMYNGTAKPQLHSCFGVRWEKVS